MPARNFDVDAVLERFFAQVRAPLPDHDIALDRARQRIDAKRVKATKDQRPDVAILHLVGANRLQTGVGELVAVVLQRHSIDTGRVNQTASVLAQAKDRRPVLGLVTANSLEDRRAVVQHVRAYVHSGLVPGNQLSVVPDNLRWLEAGHTHSSGQKGLRDARIISWGRVAPAAPGVAKTHPVAKVASVARRGIGGLSPRAASRSCPTTPARWRRSQQADSRAVPAAFRAPGAQRPRPPLHPGQSRHRRGWVPP